jgi:hypothetical protein
VLTVALAGLVVVALASAAVAKPPRHDRRDDLRRAELIGVNFVETCRFSHRAFDDPIVHPGKPGASHEHAFVGSRTTDAFSTVGSLRSGGTSCRRAEDTAAYWAPALYEGPRLVLPLGATVYYRRTTLEPVRSFPNGLRVIAGDARAAAPQSMRVTFWSCGLASGVPRSSTVPACPERPGSFLRLHVRFPECWDGRNLDSSDHASHLAYARRGVCPATHPVEVPALAQIYRYPTRGGEGFELASGGQLSAHADFLNAWHPGALRRLVDGCLNALVHCGRG